MVVDPHHERGLLVRASRRAATLLGLDHEDVGAILEITPEQAGAFLAGAPLPDLPTHTPDFMGEDLPAPESGFPAESDSTLLRLAQIIELYRNLAVLFGNDDKSIDLVHTWLQGHNLTFGTTPLTAIRDGRLREVLNYLQSHTS